MTREQAIEVLQNIERFLRSGICGQRDVWVEDLTQIIKLLQDQIRQDGIGA